MAQITVPSAPREYTTHYQLLLGVDYQADQTQVDRRRSPDMVNMISDFGGNPVKRDGYRKVGLLWKEFVMVDGRMYGIISTSSVFQIDELELDGYELKTVDTPYFEARDYGTIRSAFVYQQTIYVLTSKVMFSYNVETAEGNGVGIADGTMSVGTIGESEPKTVQSINKNIPLTVIDLKPDGTGGTAFDDKNLFSIYQQVSYKGDGTSTEYKIPNYAKMGTWVKVEVMDANGEWQEESGYTLEPSTAVTGLTLDGQTYMTNNIIDAKVTFTAPPSTTPAVGQDNVRITFCPYSMDIVNPTLDPNGHKGYYNETLVKMLSAVAVTFQNGRMFLSDGYKVHYSDVNNPYMVSDLAWFDVDSDIVAFTRSNNYLVVLARDNGKGTIYLAGEQTRTVDSETGETETYFVVKESNAGIGAIASRCVGTLSDEPMFLANTGMYGILTNWQSEKYAVNRSSRINRRLCREPNLNEAVGIAFNDYFYLAVNGRMYVLDGRHKESDRAGNKPLEAYCFEGLPAIERMFVIGDRMYFMDDTNTYTWNDDLGDTERYIDGEVTSVTDVLYGISSSPTIPPSEEDWDDTEPTPALDEYLWYKATYDDLSVEYTTSEIAVGDKKLTGDPVCCRWCSVFDDDGAPQRLKTLQKKGSMLTLVPHFKSGCEITLIKDGDVFEYLGSFDSDLQTFDYIDFNRFTFNANAVAIDKFTKKKIKKYKRLQIKIENNKAEPFGLTQVTKTYIFGNYAKR